MSRLLVDDVTKTDRRALLNVNKMATISDIVAADKRVSACKRRRRADSRERLRNCCRRRQASLRP